MEEQVWQKIEAIINDPNKLTPLLEETIENLKSRAEELWERIRPVNERLSEIEEKKAKLADEWVSNNMKPEEFQELKRSLDKEETRLKSVRSENDPVQIQELENTRGLLSFWQDQLQLMVWDTEEEDGGMIRLVDKPHKTTLQVIGIEDKEVSNVMHFPATRRELLDKLQVRVVAFHDRIDVNAIFPIEPIMHQKCTSL